MSQGSRQNCGLLGFKLFQTGYWVLDVFEGTGVLCDKCLSSSLYVNVNPNVGLRVQGLGFGVQGYDLGVVC